MFIVKAKYGDWKPTPLPERCERRPSRRDAASRAVVRYGSHGGWLVIAWKRRVLRIEKCSSGRAQLKAGDRVVKKVERVKKMFCRGVDPNGDWLQAGGEGAKGTERATGRDGISGDVAVLRVGDVSKRISRIDDDGGRLIASGERAAGKRSQSTGGPDGVTAYVCARQVCYIDVR